MFKNFPQIWDPVELEKELAKRPESFWVKRGEKMALELFHNMAQFVPAYKNFLNIHKIDHKKIKTIEDFKSVPTIDKNNYLRKYPREKLCWNGEFEKSQWVVSTTSGSTGEPFYFPRQNYQDQQYALTAELYLRTNFQIHKKSTLYIVGFPMGAWIGGLFTYEALKIIADKGYPLTIITPGINKAEILKSLVNLGPHFDQVIIGSYGPFLKDIIDDGIRLGVDWKKYNLGFVFSAEGFSEGFRDYVIKKTGLKNDYTSTLNHYGTVDLGTMSYETPVTTLLRRKALADSEIYKLLFSDTVKLPTLTQFLPEQFYFEDMNGNLLCSSYSGLPLVRYDLKDHGGVLGFDYLHNHLLDKKFDLIKESSKAGIKNTLWNLPFVYVYERSDFSVSFFAFQVYPETIKNAIQNEKLENDLTGKFTMMVKFDKNKNQYLEVNLELKADKKDSSKLKKQAQDLIMKQLLKENSEFRRTHEEYPKRVIPKIIFWPYEHSLYFRPGTKQKWVKK